MNTRLFLGTMSGTSMDGLDIALVEIAPFEPSQEDHLTLPQKPFWRLHAFETLPYPAAFKQKLLDVIHTDRPAWTDIAAMHGAIGSQSGQMIADFMQRQQLSAHQIEAIAFHGVTCFHQPQDLPDWGTGSAASLQLGDPFRVKAATGVGVICDLRAADVALGGQGAPLASFLDYLLLRHPIQNRVALNLGGIANITLLPAAAEQHQVQAFDTGPANMLMDMIAARTGQKWDEGGRIAAAGSPIQSLLDQWLKHPYFQQLPPKTCGREQFGAHFLKGTEHLAQPNLMATACALCVQTIAQELKRHPPKTGNWDQVIAAGGGVHNPVLMQRLADAIAPATLTTTDGSGLDPDAKEAVLTAFIAAAHVDNRPANLPSVTGAKGLTLLGAKL